MGGKLPDTNQMFFLPKNWAVQLTKSKIPLSRMTQSSKFRCNKHNPYPLCLDPYLESVNSCHYHKGSEMVSVSQPNPQDVSVYDFHIWFTCVLTVFRSNQHCDLDVCHSIYTEFSPELFILVHDEATRWFRDNSIQIRQSTKHVFCPASLFPLTLTQNIMRPHGYTCCILDIFCRSIPYLVAHMCT